MTTEKVMAAACQQKTCHQKALQRGMENLKRQKIC